MVVDKLKLNEEKTEFMLIGNRRQLSKIRTDCLLVAGTVASSVGEARNVGVWLNFNFNFKHILTRHVSQRFTIPIILDEYANFYHLKLLRR